MKRSNIMLGSLVIVPILAVSTYFVVASRISSQKALVLQQERVRAQRERVRAQRERVRAQYELNATLVLAARDKKTDIALRALQQGADPNARGYLTRWALIETLPLEGLLYDTKQDQHLFPALMIAADSGDAVVVQALIDRGADVNARSEDGYTALIYGVTSHQPKVTDILLKHAASPLYRTNDGKSAMDFAKALDRKQAIALLTQAEKRLEMTGL